MHKIKIDHQLNVIGINIGQAIEDVSLNPVGPDLFINNNSSKGDLIGEPIAFLESSTHILYFNNVTISGRMRVKENHNAVMFVAGDFTMNGASSLTIPDNSSLTIIIEGKLKIGSGAQVYTPDNGITAEGRPVFSIYSAYKGSGSGGIHYDTALGEASFGGSTDTTGCSGRLIFKEWRFVATEPETAS